MGKRPCVGGSRRYPCSILPTACRALGLARLLTQPVRTSPGPVYLPAPAYPLSFRRCSDTFQMLTAWMIARRCVRDPLVWPLGN